MDAVVKETCEGPAARQRHPFVGADVFRAPAEHTGKTRGRSVSQPVVVRPWRVAFGPYAERFRQLLGFDIPRVELYPASEGFLAYQDAPGVEGMLLNVNDGIFFEFIPRTAILTSAPRDGGRVGGGAVCRGVEQQRWVVGL